jgi:N-acetylneuraminic acid mutarotase
VLDKIWIVNGGWDVPNVWPVTHTRGSRSRTRAVRAESPGLLVYISWGRHLTSGGAATEMIMRTGRHPFMALIIGGLLLGTTTLAQVPAPGRWTQGAAMPSSRTEVAVAEVDGKIYVVGGFGGERELEIYDPAADRWSRGASFPREVHHAAAVGVNGKLYVIGGYVHDWAPTNALYEYDPANDRWRMAAPMPTPRGALAAAVIDGKIHAVGGVGGAGRVGRRSNTNAHEIYDPASDKWSARAALPTPRDHLAAAAEGGRLYAIGGRIDGDYGRNLAANESYDPVADRWQPCAPLPTARSGIAASVLGGRIVVVGGEAPAGTFGQVEAYDPKSDSWTPYARMPTARHGLGSAIVGGKMYVISGGPTPGASASAANEIFTP